MQDQEQSPKGHAIANKLPKQQSGAAAPMRGKCQDTGLSKTERFLASFQAVERHVGHHNTDDESTSLQDCGVPPTICHQLISWAESTGEPLAYEVGKNGASKRWYWNEAFLQQAFRRHTELFGEADLAPAARLVRDTGCYF